MILCRHPDPDTAAQVASKAAAASSGDVDAAQIELVIETGRGGRRRVTDPTHGVSTMARSDVISWGGFGLVFGAIVGAVGGGGILAILEEGLATAIGWALFGLAASSLYRLWAGRSVSAHRLRGVGSLLPPGTSALLAWAEGPFESQGVV